MRYPLVDAAARIPTRHPSGPLPVPAAFRLLATTMRLDPPDEAEFRRVGECLLEGDPLMDAVVEEMFELGRSAGKALFEQALTGGIDSLTDAPPALRALFERVEHAPDWLDPDLLDRGARVLRAGGADGTYVARDVALHGGYLFAGFNQTLLRTGALEKGSNQRFAETTRWAMDVISPRGLAPGGLGHRSTLQVRLIHSFIRRHVAAMPDWDTGAWGLPVNQTDMAATIHGTFIVPVAAASALGLFNSPRNLEAVAHLTRYVGWLIGVQDEFLPTSFREAVRLQYLTLTALATPDETTRRLAMPMAEDPLQWTFGRFESVRRRIAHSQHLSITQGALGPRAMRQLGLSPYVLPWYQVVRFPFNTLRSVRMHLPGGLDRAARRGDREMQRFLERMTSSVEIGGSVAGLHP